MKYIDESYLRSEEMKLLWKKGLLVFMNSTGSMYVDFCPRRERVVPEKVCIPQDYGAVICRSPSGYMIVSSAVLEPLLRVIGSVPYGYGLGFSECGEYFICYCRDSRRDVVGVVEQVRRCRTYQIEHLGPAGAIVFNWKELNISPLKFSYDCFGMLTGSHWYSDINGIRVNRDGLFLFRNYDFTFGGSGVPLDKFGFVCREISEGVWLLARSNFSHEKFRSILTKMLYLDCRSFALHWDRYAGRWLFVSNYNKFKGRMQVWVYFNDLQKCSIAEIF